MDKDNLPARIIESPMTSLRPISEGAEKWLHRPIPCLDYGFVYLVDYVGNDEAIAQAARVSYGKGTKKVSEDRTLIRHLLRHRHTSPFEMVELKFHCKLPIFVARQWIRHRTANVNEYSGRYSEMLNEFYLPDEAQIKRQSSDNKQGRGDELTPEQKREVVALLRREYERVYNSYEMLLEDYDLAKELARIGLSVANYTQWYWKIDLHNLMHFFRLRLDEHAQYEIRVFAEAMARIVKDAFPITYEAFEDYALNSLSLSGLEVMVLRNFVHDWPTDEDTARSHSSFAIKNKREVDEFIAKLRKIGFVR